MTKLNDDFSDRKSIQYENLVKIIKERDNKIPIYRGCDNTECYCTGRCREVIAYKEKDKNDFKI